MKRTLRVRDVFSIATGAMIGSGFFLLPGIAYALAGPAVVLVYLMATHGDHTEASANIVMTVRIIAVAIAVLLALVNAFGAKESAVFQTVLVGGLVALSIYFIGHGSFHMEAIRFAGFGQKGIWAILATSGLVFVSYAGLNKVASVAEEVRDPEKTIPRGMFLSLGVATVIYVVGIFVVVGVVPADDLASDRTPLATAAGLFAGRAGVWAMVVAGCLAFVTTANAGIMSSSRYLYAMGRDRILPGVFGRLSGRETPLWGIALSTLAVVMVVFFLDAEGIALPHVLLDGIEQYELLMARSRSPLHFPGVASGITAVFVLLGSKDNPQQHLRMLAAIARRVDQPDFLVRWQKAKDGEHVKRVLLGLPGR